MLGIIENIFGLERLKKWGNFEIFLLRFHNAGQTLLSGVRTNKPKHAPIPPQNLQVDGSHGKLLESMCVMPPVKAAGHVFTAKTWVTILSCDCKVWHIHLACAKCVDKCF